MTRQSATSTTISGASARLRRRTRVPRRATLGAAAILLATALVAAPASANGVPIHSGDLLVSTGHGKIRHFDPTGKLLDTLDVDPASSTRDDNTGVCFTPALKMYTANFSPGSSNIFDAGGNPVGPAFVAGFHENESCVVDANDNVHYGNSNSASPGIVKVDATGHLLATYPAAKDGNGVDWIDLAGNQCTVFYTSESNLIKRYNVCSSTQLPDFAKSFASFGLRCFAIRIRPDGEVMVACTNQNGASNVYRLDPTGKVVQTYPGSSLPGQKSVYALSLDPDNKTFWVADEDIGQVYHLDIASGALLKQFSAQEIDFVGGIGVAGTLVASAPPSRAKSSCDLLGTREIAKAVGQPVSAGALAADTSVCSFEAGAPNTAVKTLLQKTGGAHAFAAARRAAHGRTLAGLGTKAFFGKTAAGEQVVGMLKGSTYLFVSSVGITTSSPKAALLKLAKLAVKRASSR
jgi:hypothetical protein